MNLPPLSAAAAALLLASTAALASPSDGPGNGRDGHEHWEDRRSGPDHWRFDWLDRSLDLRCRRGAAWGTCSRQVDRYPYVYSYPYGFVLPPTGHEYLPDDWPFNQPYYDPRLAYPYSAQPVDYWPGPLEMNPLRTFGGCPDGVQRCHEDELTDFAEEPQ